MNDLITIRANKDLFNNFKKVVKLKQSTIAKEINQFMQGYIIKHETKILNKLKEDNINELLGETDEKEKNWIRKLFKKKTD